MVPGCLIDIFLCAQAPGHLTKLFCIMGVVIEFKIWIFSSTVIWVTAQLDNRSAKLEDVSVAIDSTGLPYRLQLAGNQLYLVPIMDGMTQPDYSATPRAFSVEWSESGDCAQWTAYSPQSLMPNEFTLPPSSDEPDLTGAIVGSVVAAGAVIAGAIVAVNNLIKIKKATKNIETLFNAN